MGRRLDLAMTALAPAVWGSSYIVTTEWMPEGYPLTIAALRALPAGLLLLLLARRLPRGIWWGRSLVLGALNFGIFWGLLFIAAFRMPGGLAATLSSAQPLLVVLLSGPLLGVAIRPLALGAAVMGMVGVGLLVLSPGLVVDGPGVVAALGGALSMALGTVLTRRWAGDIPPLTLTAWQMVAGGLLLAPVALTLEPTLPVPTWSNLAGFLHLGLIGAAVTYVLWFRGLARLGAAEVSTLAFLSPLSAVLLGWAVLGQAPGPIQALGMLLVLLGVWVGQRRNAPPAVIRARTA